MLLLVCDGVFRSLKSTQIRFGSVVKRRKFVHTRQIKLALCVSIEFRRTTNWIVHTQMCKENYMKKKKNKNENFVKCESCCDVNHENTTKHIVNRCVEYWNDVKSKEGEQNNPHSTKQQHITMENNKRTAINQPNKPVILNECASVYSNLIHINIMYRIDI